MRNIVALSLCLLVLNAMAQELPKHEGSDELTRIKSLELVKNSGIKKNEMHMSALTIEFESADKIKQIWTMNMDGKPSKGPAIELTRKP
jgi:hypothetical protein